MSTRAFGEIRGGPDCDVAIVGLGPVGATLALLLGERGLRVVVVERERQPAPYPRAIAVDDETLRTLLRLPGLDDAHRLFAAGRRVDVRTARGKLLTRVSFDDTPLGVAGLSFFHQPSLERALRAAVSRVANIRLILGQRVCGLRDVPGGVRLELAGDGPLPGDGPAGGLTAAWVVGCDGAGSTVRRERGIGYGGRTFAEPWIVVDVDSPEPLPHLPNLTYRLDPARPSVNMPRPGGHRFEFMLLPGEDPAVMAAPIQVNRWLDPHLAPLDPVPRSGLRIVRATAYTYHARTAARWRDGRVLLAGDAAHCMPPFGGQGLGSGVGDALALAWRLDEVVRGLALPRLLDDYARERRPRIAEMTRIALVLGRLLTATSTAGCAAARLALQTIDAAPVLGSKFRAGSWHARPKALSHAGTGIPHAGEPLPNPRVRTRDGELLRLDDVLPAGWALLAAEANPWLGVDADLLAALRERAGNALTVLRPGGFGSWSEDPAPAVEDLDGSLLGLLGPAGVALLRPDRFLVGVGRPVVGGKAALATAFARAVGA